MISPVMVPVMAPVMAPVMVPVMVPGTMTFRLPDSVGKMQITITDEAQRLLEKKGGTMSIDFIRPTG